MTQRDPAIPGYSLVIDGEYKNTLDIEGFSRMMKDPSYCYKFYWLEALVKLISEGREAVTFDDVINEMNYEHWRLTMNRPDFDDIKDFAEFSKYYWYRDELIRILVRESDMEKVYSHELLERYADVMEE